MHHNQISLDDFARDSRYLNDFVSSIRTGALAVQNLLGNFISQILLFFAFIPVWLILFFYRRKMSNLVLKGIKIDVNNYSKVRKNYDRINDLSEVLEKVNFISHSKIPFFLKIVFSEIKKLSKVILEKQELVKKELENLNDIPNDETPNIFQLIPENELWKGKIDSYQYRI